MNQLPVTTSSARVYPFLKWAGGKGGLLGQLLPLFPTDASRRRYFEPFIGGGAVFFALRPVRGSIYDINEDLIEVYQVVRDAVDELIVSLQVHRNDEEYFYFVRQQSIDLLSPVERASRFIFLNKTCFNGLHRVNRQGQFNVPFGHYPKPTICDAPALAAASAALQSTIIQSHDFEFVSTIAEKGDFVYFDPPYAPLSQTSSFTSYSKHPFDSSTQERLRDTVANLSDRGVLVALSNSAAPMVKELYRDFRQHEIMARRAINSKGHGRGPIPELLITNY